MELDVLFGPAEFGRIRTPSGGEVACVVLDILRATTTIATALHRGARAILPFATVEETLAAYRSMPGALLAGERGGLKISGETSGGVPFDFGNSPREFTAGRVRDRTILMTTTNGTRALQACAGVRWVFAGSLVNLFVTAQAARQTGARHLVVVCAGTGEDMALEDVLAAGALCERIADGGSVEWSDAARVALRAWTAVSADPCHEIRHARNARRLLSIPDLAGDVEYCLQTDSIPAVACLCEGRELRLLRSVSGA